MALFKEGIVGIEMDCGEIRIVELSGSKKKPVLENYGRIALTDGVVRDGKIQDAAAVTSCLEKLWAECNIKSRDAILGISNQDVIIRFALFPKVPLDRLRNMIYFQAREHIPIAVEELELDYLVIGEENSEEGNFYKVLLVAARKRMLNDFVEALNNARIKLMDIDSSILALGRILPAADMDETEVMIDLNYGMLDILIMKKGMPNMARAVALNQTATLLFKKILENEEFEMPVEIREDLYNTVSQIGSEIRSSIDYYQMNDNSVIKKINLVGRCGRIRNIENNLKENFGFPVSIANPYHHISIKGGPDKSKDFHPCDFAVCMSLALRGLED